MEREVSSFFLEWKEQLETIPGGRGPRPICVAFAWLLATLFKED